MKSKEVREAEKQTAKNNKEQETRRVAQSYLRSRAKVKTVEEKHNTEGEAPSQGSSTSSGLEGAILALAQAQQQQTSLLSLQLRSLADQHAASTQVITAAVTAMQSSVDTDVGA